MYYSLPGSTENLLWTMGTFLQFARWAAPTTTRNTTWNIMKMWKVFKVEKRLQKTRSVFVKTKMFSELSTNTQATGCSVFWCWALTVYIEIWQLLQIWTVFLGFNWPNEVVICERTSRVAARHERNAGYPHEKCLLLIRFATKSYFTYFCMLYDD